MRRGWFFNLMVLVALVLSLLPWGAEAAPQAAPKRSAAVDPQVVSELSKQGHTTFWVLLRGRANMVAAPTLRDWSARGRFVVDQLQQQAQSSQAGLLAELRQAKAAFRPFWIANAVRVVGDQALLDRIAARGDVERILPDRKVQIPQPMKGNEHQRTQAIEWGLERIGAPQVWDGFGVQGEGIVVANIDTGVQFDHPALINQYRGTLPGGGFDHNYNWYDPAQICGTDVPCDNDGHGTHTMGTMVGSDGGENQIGVAPGARWIAAKGCEAYWCSYESLLAAGEWVLAPTDLQGQNPRPDLRPNVVNNSWGGYGYDPFYEAIVSAWVASGIFPAFAIGNNGDWCNSAASPGNYAQSYGVAAFDSSDQIAWFSSRGDDSDPYNASKPNIAAPGVDVRSSIPGDSYTWLSGTSMATPHLAGTVALIWSAAPALVGDIEATRALLDQTALDVADLSCGGTDGNNRVWGEGKLDAFAAVELAPRGPSGFLMGQTLDASSNAPLQGVAIFASSGITRTTTSGISGTYRLRLPVGSYTLTTQMFGYLPSTTGLVTVSDGMTTTLDLLLTAVPSHEVSGTVRNEEGAAIAGVTVSILNTPIAPVTTDSNGTFRFATVPAGSYTIAASASVCSNPFYTAIVVDEPQSLEVTLTKRRDTYGYTCQVIPSNYVSGEDFLLSKYDGYAELKLPFAFPYYGRGYTSAYVSANGFLSFTDPSWEYWNMPIPFSSSPNAIVAPFWDDIDLYNGVYTHVIGEAPNRAIVIEWRDVSFYYAWENWLNFEVILFEDGRIVMQYRDIDATADIERGASATIGLENADGTDGLQYSYDEAMLGSPDFAILYSLEGYGFVQGTITNANDGLAVLGATITAQQDGQTVGVAMTGSDGSYLLQLPTGDYTISATATNYRSKQATVSVAQENQSVTYNATLRTALLRVVPEAMDLVVPVNQIRTRTVTIGNSGSVSANWSTSISAPWATLSPASGTLKPGETAEVTLIINTNGLSAGVYDGTINFYSNSGRKPTLYTDMDLIVPTYQTAVNVGGSAYTDSQGELWQADKRYTRGGWGFIRAGKVITTSVNIGYTNDDPLFQDQRANPYAYRFSGLARGTYEVELLFAELQYQRIGKRSFDVIINNRTVLPAHDMVYAVGTKNAERFTFYVDVNSGQLDVRLAPRTGFGAPIINALRVTHRPDR